MRYLEMNDKRPLLSVEGLETRFFTKTGTVAAVNGVSFDL